MTCGSARSLEASTSQGEWLLDTFSSIHMRKCSLGYFIIFCMYSPRNMAGTKICWCLGALGSTPTSGRAVQQKVEGRFNHGVNFFDAFCHQDGVSLFVWTQQLHHTMTSCAHSTFTFLSATSCNALLLESVPAMAFVEHKSLGTACSNSMPVQLVQYSH